MAEDSPFDPFDPVAADSTAAAVDADEQPTQLSPHQQYAIDPLDDPQQPDFQHENEDPFGAVDASDAAQSKHSQGPGFDEFASPPVSPSQSQSPSQQQLPLSPSQQPLNDLQSAEETPLSLWEKERAQVLAKRAAKAVADKQEAQAVAKREIEEFYKEQAAKLTQRQKTNRADEKAYRAEMSALEESGSQWEKVAKLCNTQSRSSGDKGSSAVQRTERFRKLLLTLKQQKTSAAKK